MLPSVRKPPTTNLIPTRNTRNGKRRDFTRRREGAKRHGVFGRVRAGWHFNILRGVFLGLQRQLFFLLLRLLPVSPAAFAPGSSASSCCLWLVRFPIPIACTARLRFSPIPAIGAANASVGNPIVARPANAPASGPGSPVRPTPTTSPARTTSNGSGNGAHAIRATGSDLGPPTRLPVRSLQPLKRCNPLTHSHPWRSALRLRYKIPGPLRYKIPGSHCTQCSSAFWPSRWALRYKRTSSASAMSWQLRGGTSSGTVPGALPPHHE